MTKECRVLHHSICDLWNACFASFILVLVSVDHYVCADPHVYQLYSDLMASYTMDVRPSQNHTAALNVTFGFSLTQIIDVDERNQILTTNAWLNQMWLDYKLRWNASRYGNITKLHLPHHKIWKPDIVLYNNADSQYNTAIMSTDIFVNNDGNITWLSAAIFKSSCEMNVRFYPFDEQVCEMKFASWAYDGSLIDLVLVSEQGDDSNYMSSSEWDLTFLGAKRNTVNYSCCPQPYPDITITIKIRRRPMFYVFNLIVPCILITGIALLGFYMPSASGEKVTLGITTLLSMTVFLMLVAESMPPTADTLPLIGMYYGVTICLVTFATALTVFTLNVHHKGMRGRSVPTCVKVFAFRYLARVLFLTLDPPPTPIVPAAEPSLRVCGPGTRTEAEPLLDADSHSLCPNGGVSGPRHFKQVTDAAHFSPSGSATGESGEFEAQFIRVLNKVYTTIERNEMRLADQDRKDAICIEWQQVALVIDRFLLLIFVMVTTCTTFLIIYQHEFLKH